MNASEKCTKCPATHILHIILEGSWARGKLLNKNTELGGSEGSFTSQKNSWLQKKGFALGSKVPVGLFDLQIFHLYETSQLRHCLISSSLLPSQIHEWNNEFFQRIIIVRRAREWVGLFLAVSPAPRTALSTSDWINVGTNK